MKALFFIFTLFFFQSFAQSKKINSLIAELDNSQFIIDHAAKARFNMTGKAAHKLIKIGKPAVEKLISALNDSTKVIMAHLVLCHIYYKVATFAGPKVITVNDRDISLYFLGQEKGDGLVINEINNGGNYKMFIKPKDLKEIILYWENKIIKK